MSLACGFSWLNAKSLYRKRFGEEVPDWVCVYDMCKRARLVRSALNADWRMPDRVLIRDEFHKGQWSIWT